MPEQDIVALLRRLDATERNQSDLAKSITGIVEEVGDVEKRVGSLEQAHHDRRVNDATMAQDIKTMKNDIAAIKGAGSKLLWIVAGAIVLAFVGFVLRGGPLGS